MKNISIVILFFGLVVSSCGNGAAKYQLSAKEFSDKIKSTPGAPILDVRTPGEYAGGHLENAVNVDWNSSAFDNSLASYDKSKAVFVYCLSGARSASAARHMRQVGFKNVYEMDGGIMKWRAANLPLSSGSATRKSGMTQDQYAAMVKGDASHSIVVIDFYADWCAPCKRMKPYLDEISREMGATVIVKRVNADDNPDLCKSLNVDALPTVKVYKNNALVWSNVGYVEKSEVLKHLK